MTWIKRRSRPSLSPGSTPRQTKPGLPRTTGREGDIGMAATIRAVGISGSLRQGSYNTALLRAAQALAPEGLAVEIADIRDIPLYDDDVRGKGLPLSVQRFRGQLAAADAIIIATPEYNFSIPGVLKNAIDWASRPPDQPFAGKPVAIMGAAAGALGTARAQYHLRQVLVFLDGHPLNKPEVFVGSAPAKFGPDGELADGPTRDFVAQQMRALLDWARRLKAAG